MSSEEETTQVLQVWELAIPLPAVMILIVSFYMMVLGIGLWIRLCLKDHCSSDSCSCCTDISLCERCFRLAERCNCNLPTSRSCVSTMCPTLDCEKWDCACTGQPPECESCNCLCFEIRIK